MQARPSSDFAIVGAGLTGVALAYGLARLGKSVVILERRDQVQVLNQPSHGLLWAQANLTAVDVQREWNSLALANWSEFDEQLCSISASLTHYERPGGVWLATDMLALQGRHLQAEEACVDDPELEWLDSATLKRLVHSLSDDVVGASYCADDGQLNLHLLHRAFDRALDNLNVERSYLSTVERVYDDSQGGYRLCGEGFELNAAHVVLATGGQSPELVQALGFEPLRTVVDNLCETAQVRHFMPFPAWQLRQSRDGSLILPMDADGQAGESWQTAVLAYPQLARLPIRRQWQDTRCDTHDALPRYQRSAQMSGVYRVASPDSLLHCPLHASLVPAWLAGKLADQAMAPFLIQPQVESQLELEERSDLHQKSPTSVDPLLLRHSKEGR